VALAQLKLCYADFLKVLLKQMSRKVYIYFITISNVAECDFCLCAMFAAVFALSVICCMVL